MSSASVVTKIVKFSRLWGWQHARRRWMARREGGGAVSADKNRDVLPLGTFIFTHFLLRCAERSHRWHGRGFILSRVDLVLCGLLSGHSFCSFHRKAHVRSRRPVAFRWSYAIDATRLHQTRPWVVSFSILSAFRARSRLDTCHTQVRVPDHGRRRTATTLLDLDLAVVRPRPAGAVGVVRRFYNR